MSLTTIVKEWMRGVGPREESVVIARTHVNAETLTDVDKICETISRDVYFGVPVRTREGNRIPEGTVLTTYDQVHDYYANRAGGYVVTDSLQLKTVGTDWYTFNESAATLLGTGMLGDVDATGLEFVVNSAVIFPTAPDGIRGEVCVTRHPFGDIVQGTVQVPPAPDGAQAHLPSGEIANAAMADRFLGALGDGDPTRIAAELSDDHTMAVRLDDVDGAQMVHTAENRVDAQDAFSRMIDGVDDLTIMTRIATDWYVFAEYLMRRSGGGVRRLAATHPVRDGKLAGTFGYGRDER